MPGLRQRRIPRSGLVHRRTWLCESARGPNIGALRYWTWLRLNVKDPGVVPLISWVLASYRPS